MEKEPDVLCVSCSEAVFKLGGIEFGAETDVFPNGLVDELIASKDEINIPPTEKFVEAKLTDVPLSSDFLEREGYFEFIDNRGGGANFGYIEEVVEEFVKFKLGQITEEEFRKRDEEIWGH